MAKDVVFEDFFRAVLLRKKLLSEEVEEAKNLCNIVYAKHFSSVREKEDLVQEGLFGILDLLRSDNYNPKQSALNFVYTKVRNSMTNYLSKKKPAPQEDDVLIGISGTVVFQYSSLTEQIFSYINERLQKWCAEDLIRDCITVYFQDKFDIESEPPDVIIVTNDFLVQYEYYINVLEYGIYGSFINTDILKNDVREVLRVLEFDNDLDSITRLFGDTIDKKTLVKLLYLFSGTTVRFPSKFKLLRTDMNISIYKSIKSGRFDYKKASKFFNKPVEVIQSVYRRINRIYK